MAETNQEKQIIDIPEIGEIMNDIESTMLIGMHPMSSSTLLPSQTFQQSVLAPAIQTPLSFSANAIQTSALYQDIQEKQNKTKLIIMAIIWVSIYVFLGALYTGWHFLLTTIPFMLKFIMGKIGTIPFFLFLAISEYRSMNQQQREQVLQVFKDKKGTMIAAFIAHSFQSMTVVLPAKYTTVAMTILFGCCSSMCIVIYKLITRQRVHWLAIVGTFIGLGGSSLTVLEGDSKSDQSFSTGSIIFGNTLALAGSALAATFSILTHDIMKSQFPVGIYSTICTISCVVLAFPVSLLIEYEEYAGIVWQNDFILVSLLIGFNGFIAIYAIMKALELISPLLLTTASLCQFMIAGIQAWLMGINSFPGVWVWTGGAITVIGLFSIVKSEQYETQSKIDLVENTKTYGSASYQKLKPE